MTESAPALNPFDPCDSQHATWPQPFEPGRDLAELTIVNTSPTVVMPGASVANPLTKRQAQDLRRAIVEDNYSQRMMTVLGDDLTRIHRHPVGATLYFKQPGRIADEGCKLTVLGGMDEKLAALRIVALARERGWQSIQFTGSGSFVELAMREALKQRLTVIARDARQKLILAKVLAEREDGSGAATLPAGAVPASADIPAILAELDDLSDPPVLPRPGLATSEISMPRPAPPAPPAPPNAPPQLPVGVLPVFMNLRERLQHRRTQVQTNAPTHKNGPPPKRPGPHVP